jgi:DNA-directed RNA polymerase specialized sigma24 family protein
MNDDRPVTDLVTRARSGDKRAWDDLVERYAPLAWAICRRHQLSDADAADVHQNVWLQLVSQLDRIRDPAALAGWPPPPGGNAPGPDHAAAAAWTSCAATR